MPDDAPFADLVEVMARLRRECAWTREQTHDSLGRYLLEEAHETLEAIDSGDPDHLREELGDLLMQVVFHAAIAADTAEGWSVDDVVRDITDKLVRRNPHVFADGAARTPDEIDAAWQAIKATEKSSRTSVHAGIPSTLPALSYADKVLKRLGDPAVDVPSDDDLGVRLLALVAEARAQGVDAEETLRRTVRGLG